MKRKEFYALGIMSGTSTDGLDFSLIKSDGKEKIKIIQNEVESFYKNFELNSDFIELRNLVLVARLIIESAILRKESRGLHYNIDFPNKIRNGTSSVISKKELKVA